MFAVDVSDLEVEQLNELNYNTRERRSLYDSHLQLIEIESVYLDEGLETKRRWLKKVE